MEASAEEVRVHCFYDKQVQPGNKKMAFRFQDHSLTGITLALSLIMFLLNITNK